MASVFRQEDGAVTGHGDKHIAGALLLQLLGIGDNLLVSGQLHAEHIPQLVIVGLDEEGMIFEDLQEQPLLGIHHHADALAIQAAHDALVDVIRQGVGNGAGQHQGVALHQLVQLGEKLCLGFFADLGALAVDLRLLVGLDLHIDAGEAVRELHEVVSHAEALQLTLDLLAGEAGQKAQRRGLDAHVAQDDGHIDALAAPQHLLVVHTVDLACGEGIQPHDVVKCRVKSNCINHLRFLLESELTPHLPVHW